MDNKSIYTRNTFFTIGSMATLTKDQVSRIVTDAVDRLALAVKAGFDEVDGKFKKIEGRFDKVDEKFKTVEAMLNALDAKLSGEFSELSDKFDALQTSVDAYAVKADTYVKEMAAMQHAIKRHEKWIEQLAKAGGVKLEY